MHMDHPEKEIILDDNRDKIMMLSIKRKFILRECNYQAEIIELWE